MNELVEFLRARLDEDERIARAATAEVWWVDNETYPESINAADGVQVVAGGRWGGEASVFDSSEDALHIARHDPARVLADVEAKRQLVDMPAVSITAAHVPDGSHDGRDPDEADTDEAVAAVAEATLRLLALPYADHPDYREEWKP